MAKYKRDVTQGLQFSEGRRGSAQEGSCAASDAAASPQRHRYRRVFQALSAPHEMSASHTRCCCHCGVSEGAAERVGGKQCEGGNVEVYKEGCEMGDEPPCVSAWPYH